jgi:hypothetical protein
VDVSRQSRNVPLLAKQKCPLLPGLVKVHVKLRVPVKRRRAMLASNPLRNSRSELVATMSKRVSFRRALGPGPDPTGKR